MPVASAVERLARREAPADDLHQAGPEQRVLRAAAGALRGRQAAGQVQAVRRDRRGQLVERDEPRDLLDHVSLARDVRTPPVRNRHVEAVVGVRDAEPQRFERAARVGAVDVHPQQPVELGVVQPDHGRRGAGAADVDRARLRGRSDNVGEELRGERLRVHRLLRLELLLEAPAGLRAQVQPRHRAVDVRAVPGRSLEQHARGGLGDLRALAAHDAGDRRRAVGVLDHDHLRVERALDVVERDHRLAVARVADVELAAGDVVEVEGVRRLPGEQHHVVGDVDDVVDRPLAGGRQARLQPQRRRRDRHVLVHARGEARAQLGVLDRDGSRCDGAVAAGALLSHGGGASAEPVAACASRATP